MTAVEKAIQAAILLAKIPHFEDEIAKRQQAAQYYSDHLRDVAITPYIEPYNTSVFAQYTIQVEDRDGLKGYLQEKGVPTAIHYPMPLHLQECFSYLGYKEGGFPVAEAVAKRVISLPMHPFISREEQDLVIDSILEFHGRSL